MEYLFYSSSFFLIKKKQKIKTVYNSPRISKQQ